MARVPGLSTITPKPYRVLQGPGALELGAVLNNDPGALGATLTSVGLTDGAIEWNQNAEINPLTSDQMFNPHGFVDTAWAHQVSLSLDQSDIWNIALACSYDQDAVSASTFLLLDAYQPAPYRCARITTEAARNTGASSQATQQLELYKCKVISSGAVSFGRTVKTSIPIIIHAAANSNDHVGNLNVTEAISKPYYE